MAKDLICKVVCAIRGAGSIGFGFIKAIHRIEPKSVVIVDSDKNGLAELLCNVRDREGFLERRLGGRIIPC